MFIIIFWSNAGLSEIQKDYDLSDQLYW